MAISTTEMIIYAIAIFIFMIFLRLFFDALRCNLSSTKPTTEKFSAQNKSDMAASALENPPSYEEALKMVEL